MKLRLNRHPHHEMYRTYCSSGFVLGRARPLPPLEHYAAIYDPPPRKGRHTRTEEQRKKLSESLKRAWARKHGE